MSVEIPQWVASNIVAEQQREWGPRLRALDPNLHLIPPFQNPPHPAMLPERWHLARFNEVVGREVIIPIITPDGGFREMDEAMFESLKRMDTHSNRSGSQRQRAEKLRRQAAQRAKEREKADRVGQIAERVESAERVSIRVPKGV